MSAFVQWEKEIINFYWGLKLKCTVSGGTQCLAFNRFVSAAVGGPRDQWMSAS